MFNFEEFIRQQVENSWRTGAGGVEGYERQLNRLEAQHRALLVENLTAEQM